MREPAYDVLSLRGEEVDLGTLRRSSFWVFTSDIRRCQHALETVIHCICGKGTIVVFCMYLD